MRVRSNREREKAEVAALTDELQLVVGALVRRMRAVSPASDVTLTQISILKRLDREGRHSVVDLARLDKITHQSITVAVANLVTRDLICRIPDSHDRRRKLLVITDSGRHLLTERRQAGHGSLSDAIVGKLNAVERKRLSQALPLLRRLL